MKQEYLQEILIKYFAALLRRSLTGTTELVENRDRSQFLGYSQLNQYLCACLKLLENKIDAGQTLNSMEIIKSERVYMIMNMVQSRKVKYAKSTYKENINSIITTCQLVGENQRIEEALWDRNKKFKNYSMDVLCYRLCFLINKCVILRGESLFWC